MRMCWRREKNTEKHKKNLIKFIFSIFYYLHPDFFTYFFKEKITDKRDQNKAVYPLSYTLCILLFSIIFRISSRRKIRAEMEYPLLLKNIRQVIGERRELGLPHPDTLFRHIEYIDRGEIIKIRDGIVDILQDKRLFERMKVLGGYYAVVIDGSVIKEYRTEAGKRRLIMIESVIVSKEGMVIGIDRVIKECGKGKESEKSYVKKEIIPRIRRRFRKAKIVLILDALYIDREILDICKKYGWGYIIVLKGNGKEVNREFDTMKERYYNESQHIISKEIEVYYENGIWWIENNLKDKREVNVIEAKWRDERGREIRYRYMTNIEISKENAIEVANTGRLRWKIENKIFNEEKNLGYSLNHIWSKNIKTLEKFLILMQIAHIICSIMENSREGERIRKALGIGIVAMWIVIKVEMRMEVVEIEEAKKRKRIKMRWDEDTS